MFGRVPRGGGCTKRHPPRHIAKSGSRSVSSGINVVLVAAAECAHSRSGCGCGTSSGGVQQRGRPHERVEL
jgi:hypothetical protein